MRAAHHPNGRCSARADVGSWRYSRGWPFSRVELTDAGVRFVTPLRGERYVAWADVVAIEAVRGTVFAPVTQFVFRIDGGDVWVSPAWPPRFRRLLDRCAPEALTPTAGPRP